MTKQQQSDGERALPEGSAEGSCTGRQEAHPSSSTSADAAMAAAELSLSDRAVDFTLKSHGGTCATAAAVFKGTISADRCVASMLRTSTVHCDTYPQ